MMPIERIQGKTMTHRMPTTPRMNATCAALVLLLLGGSAGPALAQDGGPAAPFAAGEVLTYRGVSGRFGRFGRAIMRVDGPMDVRGVQALQLSFDFKGRVGIFKVEQRGRSWITQSDMASLRYEQRERSPLGSKNEEVDIFPDTGRWVGSDGKTGETVCEHPLDELSFIYYIRSLPLKDGEEYFLVHHFDAQRNPVTLRAIRREITTVPAGEFATVVVEMYVRDERVSSMRFFLTDDEARIPVRIESSAPWVGSTRLLLESVSGAKVAAR